MKAVRLKIAASLFLAMGALFVVSRALLFAEPQASEDQTDQRESASEQHKEGVVMKPESAGDIVQLLKERALLRLKKKRKAQLLKTKLYASVAYGYETNVSQYSDTKGDYYTQEYFSLSWQPIFNRYLGLETGYWLFSQTYSEQTNSNYLDHALNFSVNLTPFKSGRFKLSPGIEYEWLWYPLSADSTYDSPKYFLKLQHYIGKTWNYGVGYEYSEKTYDERRARNQEKMASVDNIMREDKRHSVDAYITKYIGKYIFKIKGRAYVNTSNDQYLEYYDYYSVRPSISIGRAFLKDDSLYVSFNPSFERRDYMHRTAFETARYDSIATWAASFYYVIKKPFTLSYKFSYSKLDTNASWARYKNIINSFGLSVDF